MSEADDPIDANVAADHALGQERQKRLIDDASTETEIRFAPRHEIFERQRIWPAAAARMQNGNTAGFGGGSTNEFELPNPLPGVAAVLLEDPRPMRAKSWRKGCEKIRHAPVEMRIGAPTEMFGAIQNFLDAHL